MPKEKVPIRIVDFDFQDRTYQNNPTPPIAGAAGLRAESLRNLSSPRQAYAIPGRGR
jgi:hypothetical protein